MQTQKGKSPGIIADELEEDSNTIRALCDIANRHAPDYDVQQIVKEYQPDKNLKLLSANK